MSTSLGTMLVELGLIDERQLAEARALGGDRVSSALLELGYLTRAQLTQAMQLAHSRTRRRLGDVLVALGHVTPSDLAAALRTQAENKDSRPLGELLVEAGACTFEQVFDALRLQHAPVKDRRVLVVDDSPIVCSLLVQGLRDQGYDLVSMTDPLRALAELDEIRPDIVVSDLEMPGIGGAELCREIKHRTNGKLPVIILTANENDTAIEGLQAGADDYVRKSTSLEEIGARIDMVLRRVVETQRVRTMFARYTSVSIVDQVLETNDVVLAGERRDVTVLFVDVRGFTRFAEKHEPELVMTTLNEVLGRLADAVLAHGGHVDKFLGDGLMAVFGAPVRQADHAERGLRAGLLMLQAIQDRDRTCNPELRLAIGVGVNSGPVIAGSIGNERRTEYTCIGDTVNVASRLCGLAGEGELLLGATTVELTQSTSQFEALPPVQLKGKSQALPVFRAVSLT